MKSGEQEASRLVPAPWMGATFGMIAAFMFLGSSGPMSGVLAMIGGAFVGGLVDAWLDGHIARARGWDSTAEVSASVGAGMFVAAIGFCIFWMLTVYTPLGA